MNNGISTYDELLQEKKRLESLLASQKNQIKTDLRELKEEFHPVINVASMVSKLITREDSNSPVVTTGTNITIDLLVTRLFSKSNFLVRLLVPVLLKNLSSHYVPKAVPMIQRILGKRHHPVRQE